MELDLNSIEALMRLMQTFKIDRLKIQDLELTKTRHEGAKAETGAPPNLTSLPEEDILFWSTNAPPIPREALDEIALAPSKTKRTKG